MFSQIYIIFLSGWFIFVCTLFADIVEATTHPSLQIISENDAGLTLELNLPPFDIETIQAVQPSCQRILLSQWGQIFEPGLPALPVKGVLLQVPQQGEITTQVLEVQEKVLPNMELCPVPEQSVSQTGKITFQWLRNDVVYQNNNFLPDRLLEMGTRSILRGVSVTRVRIFPFQWNPITQELRYFQQIRFQIQFENSWEQNPTNYLAKRGIEGAGVYEAGLQKTIINYRQPLPLTLTASPLREREGQRVTRQMKPDDALRIEITKNGIYNLSYQNLADAGLQPQWMNPKRLRLFNQGQEVAIQVIAQDDSQFQPGDFIQFYAQALKNTFTDTNVYWLYWRKKGFGNRLTQINGKVTGQGRQMSAFPARIRLEQNEEFWHQTAGAPEQDYWFWQKLNALEVKKYPVALPSLFTPSQATIRVALQGRSTIAPHPNHHTVIKLNDIKIGQAFWDGNSAYMQEILVSSELLREKGNLLTIEMPGDTGALIDVIYLNWIEVEYWRNLEAVNDNLVFTVPETGEPGSILITVKKLTQPDMIIYDITNPYQVAEIIHFTSEGENGDYQASFEIPSGDSRTYYIATRQQIKTSFKLTPWQPSQLKSPKNGADYILMTTQAFLPVVQPLIELRRRQGLRVKAVSVEDIYNEFNDGLFAPAALKDFLHHAYHHWNPPAPTYVFLIGDANLNYAEKTHKVNQVPVHLSAGEPEGLIPDDNWYVSVDGNDILPDMLIGRSPGKNVETVAQIIDKIIRFEQSTIPNPGKILLVADNDNQFEELNEALIDYLPTAFQVDKVYLRSYFANATRYEQAEQIAQATQDIMNSLNSGAMISNYIGHGVTNRWRSAKGLLNPADIQLLTNEEALTFVLMLTCVNGYFANPSIYSLAEEFIWARGGAIGAFAPSTLSYLLEDTILAQEIFALLFEQDNKILGVITTFAKIATYERGSSANMIKKLTFFGDPAVRLKDW